MDFEKYLEKMKGFVEESTLKQRFLAGIFLAFILIGYVIFLNPAKRLLEMRNSQRRSDVVNILNTVYQYAADNKGPLPESITNTPAMICQSKAVTCEGLVDLTQILAVEKKLLSEVPVDPNEKDPNASGYQIVRLSNGRISVSAPLAENNAVISLSK